MARLDQRRKEEKRSREGEGHEKKGKGGGVGGGGRKREKTKSDRRRKGNNLRMAFWNVAGLKKKEEEFWRELEKWDVMVLMELG